VTVTKRVAILSVAVPVGVAGLATATLWLAAAIFLAANHRSIELARPLSVVDYWRAYAGYPVLGRRLRGSILLSAILCFAALPLGVLSATERRRPLHGDARFARRPEVAKAGLLGSRGIIVGRYGRAFLMLGGQHFALLCAPTRSGKGAGVVIPNMLSWPESAVVNDLKGEVYKATSGFRARHQTVYLWDPFTETGSTDRFNPLAYVRTGDKRVGDTLAIAHVIYPHNEKGGDTENFFNSQARNLFLGLFLMVQETPQWPLTIGELLRQSSGCGRPLKDYLAKTIRERREAGNPLSDECVDALMRFLSNPENTLGSVLATFNAPLVIFADRVVDAATSANDFDLRELRRSPMSVYVRIAPSRLAQARVILSVFWTLLINVNTREVPEDDPRLKHQVLLVLDEFPALGHVAVLAKGVGYLAGYNLRFLTIAQSISQLNEIYGANGARALATNHALQIVFAPREQQDANEYSEMLGYLTAVSVSKSASSGGRGSSVNRTEHRRALMLPQELKELGPDRQIVLYENAKPILAQKIFYYRDPAFVERLLPPPKVPLLHVDENLARAQRRVRPATDKDLEDGPAALVARLAHRLEGLPPVHNAMTPEEMQGFVSAFVDCLEPMAPAADKRAGRKSAGTKTRGGAEKPDTDGSANRQIPLFPSEADPAELAMTR
jgi:type IV secretion system protein VirD4